MKKLLKNLTEESFYSLYDVLEFIVLCLVIVIVIYFLLYFNLTSKKFKGYYLATSHGEHCIFINWENRLDKICCCFYNRDEALKTFYKLQKFSKKEEK